MIVEGIVTTIDAEGKLNIAPMGPWIGPSKSMNRFVLRPFRSSTTYQNLIHLGEGVFHLTDDVKLIAHSVMGGATNAPVRPAEQVNGKVLIDCCRYEEFRVIEVGDDEERATMIVESVHSGWVRDFLGFNRAKNLVIETAILASRAEFLSAEELLVDLPKYRRVVIKTGERAEVEAFEFLAWSIRSSLVRRGLLRNEPEP
jgi:uncharacterized protein